MPKTQSLTLRTRALGGLGGFGLGAILSLLLYYNLTKNLLKQIHNPYLKITSGVGMSFLGLCISPLIMLVFGGYGAHLGAELGLERFNILVKGMLDSFERKPPSSPKEAAHSTTELAFLLQKDDSADAPTSTPANVIAFPSGGYSPSLYAKTSVVAPRSKRDLQIDTSHTYHP